MTITLNDAEQAFADSPRGRMLIATAKRSHDIAQAHRGANARPWTDAMAADVARTMMTREARSNVAQAVMDAKAPRAMEYGRGIRDASRAAREDRLRNAWQEKR